MTAKSLNATHHTGAWHFGRSSFQCSSHKLAGSSRNGSHPSSPRRHEPKVLGPAKGSRGLSGLGRCSRTLNAIPQYRMALTMFLPTPSFTVESCSVNTVPDLADSITALRSQPKRG